MISVSFVERYMHCTCILYFIIVLNFYSHTDIVHNTVTVQQTQTAISYIGTIVFSSAAQGLLGLPSYCVDLPARVIHTHTRIHTDRCSNDVVTERRLRVAVHSVLNPILKNAVCILLMCCVLSEAQIYGHHACA